MMMAAGQLGMLTRADGSEIAAFDRATAWINSPRLTSESLVGKVVLVDFWTYTCINWLRTLPYVRAWSQRYKERLVVIGVHTPEFPFEHDLENVRRAVRDMKIDYPVAVDNDYGIWRAFDNNYWPALYALDGRGRVRYHQYGEGEYDRSERFIQRLLADAGAAGIPGDLVSVDAHGVEAPADVSNLRSAENYLGYQRTENFASGSPELNRRRLYSPPTRLGLNHWGLAGEWTVTGQAVGANAANGRIVYRFHARDLHLVMGPSRRDNPVRFRVAIDGRSPGAAHGLDVDEGGNGIATQQRMYQLIRQPAPIVDRQFEIEFLDGGVEAFSFTFG